MSAEAKVAHVVEIVGTAGTVGHMDRVAAAAAVLLHNEVLGPSFHALEVIFSSGEVTASSDEGMGPFAVVHTVHMDNCPNAARRQFVVLVVLAGCPASHHARSSDP